MSGDGAVRELALQVLGPLVVRVGDRSVSLTAGRLRTVLAVLAMSAGTMVSVDRLGAAVWGSAPPSDVVRSAQTYVARLRAALGAGAIATRPGGYLLQVHPDQVDALRFRRLVTGPASRERLGAALALWRGEPFDGVRSEWLDRIETPALVEQYLGAVGRCADLDLAAGRPAEVVDLLTGPAARYPLCEPLWARLLVALARCGRAAEALERFETVRRRLADDLGADPGPELRAVHADLLVGADRPAVSGSLGGVALAVPQQLPAAVDGFVGRQAALRALDELVGGDAGAIRVATVSGMAGVGKTTLAVHWAHRVRHRFPHGQLHIDLRGFGASGPALRPAEAVRAALDALGVEPRRIPVDPAAQAALYRSLLADRAVLIVLDNARDSDQVRPLLPASPGCLVLVTSRDRLTGLVATANARHVPLGVLSSAEAHELLAGRLGPGRASADPGAVVDLAGRCGRLPLALAVVAAHALTHPELSLAELAARLDTDRAGLSRFPAGDPATTLGTVFSWSYRALTPPAARLLRLLGTHPGPQVSVAAAASLLGAPPAEVRPLLAELTGVHLLTERLPDCYVLHDLLAAYAAQLAADEPADDRRAASARLLDHYLHTCHLADRLVHPQREAVDPPPPGRGAVVEPLAGPQDALAWFVREQANLLAAVEHAGRTGADARAWWLAWVVWEFLDQRGHLRHQAAVEAVALDAARRLGDRVGQSIAHRTLAHLHARLGAYRAAEDHLDAAVELAGQVGTRSGEAFTHLAAGQVSTARRRYGEALVHGRHALELVHSADRPDGAALALRVLGSGFIGLGQHRQALWCCRRALDIHRSAGQRREEAADWDGIGRAQHHLRDYRQAASAYRRALDIYRQLGDRWGEATALVHLGETCEARGHADPTHDTWRRALALADDLGHPDADYVRSMVERGR
jgi:DNA-binding SARP family transcriptional activator/tetratricopeptide (TPR) repeat protein